MTEDIDGTTGTVGSIDGLLVVDKPAGMTSHDVVAQVRRLVGTRRVGHAGTLDPMATGVLVLGLGRATRLLGYLGGTEKCYLATIRLGQASSTDDADGEITQRADAGRLTEEQVRTAMGRFVGTIEQVPSTYSAVKVAGRRAYARARDGEHVELAPRTVTVSQFSLRRVAGRQAGGPVLDVDVEVRCSAGTYVRALARDLGSALGVGGHLVALRRTRVGSFELTRARPLADLVVARDLVPVEVAAAEAFPVRRLDAAAALALSHGRTLPAIGLGPGPVAAIDPDGTLVALLVESGPLARPLAVLAPAGQ